MVVESDGWRLWREQIVAFDLLKTRGCGSPCPDTGLRSVKTEG